MSGCRDASVHRALRPSSGGLFPLQERGPADEGSLHVAGMGGPGSLELDPQAYAGHRFHIGAATAAARAGLEDSVIQSLGRWSSGAFLRYIRTTRDRLATYSRLSECAEQILLVLGRCNRGLSVTLAGWDSWEESPPVFCVLLLLLCTECYVVCLVIM